MFCTKDASIIPITHYPNYRLLSQFNQWVRVSNGKEPTPSMAITDSQPIDILEL